ncbi:hypothetical protein NQ318_008071 [Aromia moschata]|uniref:Uncharacterized protein n=1 Tax=Aromia moschata TaxID=1265417 RepID=A0AAV8YPR5_9CUCU|nr:hypothetical protein NQ318_008071 [Aromia moschata]
MSRHNLFSNEEMRDMVCVYSKENFNGRRAHRRYLEIFLKNLYDILGETDIYFRPKRDSAARLKTFNPEPPF